MTRMSVASLKVTNPSISRTVVCDAVSAGALRCSRDPLLDEVDIVVCNTPPGDADYRNRHMKTRLREIVAGHFLFLDSDTCVRGDLSPIFGLDADIAGAYNHSKDRPCEQIWEHDLETLSAMNWQVEEGNYINGGVLFYNETSGARRFSSSWHQKWIESSVKLGRHRDQPALNAAIFEAKPRVQVLPHRFNAQLKVAPNVAEGAVVWHFYASMFGPALTSFERSVKRVLEGELLPSDAAASIIECRHPWIRKSWLDDWIAKRLGSNENMDPGYQAWFQGKRAEAFRYWTTRSCKHYSARTRRFLKRFLLPKLRRTQIG